MKISNNKNRGFTLIELLIAMTIFLMFIGVLFSSYTAIIKGQKEVNDYRVMYSEARRVFERITEEVRNGIIYYPENQVGGAGGYSNPDLNSIVVLSKEMNKASVFDWDDSSENLNYCDKNITKNLDYTYSPSAFGDSYVLNSDTKIKEFKVNIYPSVDPYRLVNVNADSVQFQPMVHIEATFEKETAGSQNLELTLFTSVSSRYYGESQIVQNVEGCSIMPMPL